MASSVSFYTCEHYDELTPLSATSEATGYEKENAFDLCLSTYWKGSSTAAQILSVDFGEAKTFDSGVIFVNNNDESISSGTGLLQYSADNSAWTTLASFTWNNTGVPLRLIDDTDESYRYWRITASSVTNIAEVSLFMPTNKVTLSWANELPERSPLSYRNSVTRSGDFVRYVVGESNTGLQRFHRTYTALTSANLAILQGVYEDCRGSRYPLVIQEGATEATAKLVRIVNASFDPSMTCYGRYNVEMEFEEVPYITGGETM